MKTILIGTVQEIQKSRSKKFMFKENRIETEGFAIFYKGQFHAYVNRCKHVTLPLDFGDNDFFTDDHKFLLCKNHGALYEPATGECVAGPCIGAFLDPLPTEVKTNNLYCHIK